MLTQSLAMAKPTCPPILLILWRRPHKTESLINALRVIKPRTLYLACDGPRHEIPGEDAKVKMTRDTVQRCIDWDCDIHTLYSDHNLGCKSGVVSAINWFFQAEEEGIILEDDCIPSQSFFDFCAHLLHHYRNDTRVWAITGSNFQDGQIRGDGSYYFSTHFHCWGWATWRRTWHQYDPNMCVWPSLRATKSLRQLFPNPFMRLYWSSKLNALYDNGIPDTWDYQMNLSCFANSGLIATPNYNLVSNIGFGQDATHTTKASKPNQRFILPEPIKHPTLILRHSEADNYTFKHHCRGYAFIPILKSLIRSTLNGYFLKNRLRQP